MSKLAKALTAAAGNAGSTLGYVEDVFSTYLYTGNGSTQSITNDIDLDGEGGMVWLKQRTIPSGTGNHFLYDSARGYSSGDAGNGYAFLSSNTTGAEGINSQTLGGFNSNGFSLLADSGGWGPNQNTSNICSWTFRKAEKFFDVVTYTGDGTNGRQISHSLGSVPGMVICKSVSGISTWAVKHISSPSNEGQLNSTAAFAGYGNFPTSYTGFTDSYFTVDAGGSTNSNGATYVAYLFASDAGGFGDDGSESIIKCGEFSVDGSYEADVECGFEPQWVLIKPAEDSGSWLLFDTMRGAPVGGDAAWLAPDLSQQEAFTANRFNPTATGFHIGNYGITAGNKIIYIAIRRPMKTPESGTEVFNIGTKGANRDNSSTSTYYAGFPVDMALKKVPVDANANNFVSTRMLGTTDLKTNSVNAERTGETEETFDSNTHWNSSAGTSSTSYSWMFKRATGFFDVVCLNSTTSAAQVLSHNLGVAPELIISKGRNVAAPWQTMDATNYLRLNTDQADLGVPVYHTFTSTTFSIDSGACSSGENWVFYLFATLAGVSKVGSYTGTGADLNVDCGFSAGARFILIKRTDSTGDWYVWDSVRGIVAGNDPYLLLNTTAAEVTNTDYVDPLNAGFTVTSSAPAALNASGGTYIFLAIA